MNAYLQSLFGLDGQCALVTGGAGGIGRGIARALAEAGARVIVADCDEAAAHAVAGELRGRGLLAEARVVDLRDEAQVATLFDELATDGCEADILVNCAGIYPKIGFFDVDAAQWDAVHRLNLRGSFLCMQKAIAGMLARKRAGRVINISSVAALHPATHANSHYAAAKAGLIALTRGAALEFTGRGITVNAVLPGPIASDTAGAAAAQVSADAPPVIGPAADRSRWLAGRFGTPDEVAAAVLFLAGPGGAYVSGQTLVVDGGFLVS